MRKTAYTAALVILGLTGLASFAGAVPLLPTRQDVIWARNTNGAPITLDGVLDEPAWALADTMTLKYRDGHAIPGSGWKDEGGLVATDSMFATIRFLSNGNNIYLGVDVKDQSVGGSLDFNRFDGLLMAVKDRLSTNRPRPPAEYFYSWWYPNDATPTAPGKEPGFIGRWGNFPPSTARTPEQIDAWDAKTKVHGLSNSDAVPDTGYTIEMKFNLTPMGYNITTAQGDIFEWNVSIYDCDWLWPIDPFRFSSNRTWWQGPWGNALGYNEVRVYAKPSVTITSGAAPDPGFEFTVPNGENYADPVIDGNLNDAVWANAPSFDIRYGDDALRNTYSNVGPWRAGQFQPSVNGGNAFVFDPGDATVKYFFKGNKLYLGFDVRDQVVQFSSVFDRWDGIMVTLNQRDVREPNDHTLDAKRLTFQVGPTGQALPQDYLPTMIDTLHKAAVALQLKAGTTVDTLGQDVDQGYTAELMVDMTGLGYPSGLGDHLMWMGVNLMDGDSYIPFTDSYGTRTWWYREYENICCPPWGLFDAQTHVNGVGDGSPGASVAYALEGNSPNPFRLNTVIRFSMPEASDVALDVFDLQGRQVASRHYGVMPAGSRVANFAHPALTTGVYMYRLRMSSPNGGAERASLSGKMMVLN